MPYQTDYNKIISYRMNKDYYQILEVTRECDGSSIAKAYRKLALKYHPSRSTLDPSTAEHYFCLVSEAYEVLSDPKRRAFFDQYGEQTLKEGFFKDGQV
jgi:DnaJ-class molecular chaperone